MKSTVLIKYLILTTAIFITGCLNDLTPGELNTVTSVTVPTITAPLTNTFTRTLTQALSGVCISGNTVRISGDIDGSPITSACSSNSFTQALSLTTTDGLKMISVVQFDSASNSSDASSININLDRTAPSAPIILTPSNNSTVTTASQTITGSCESNAAISISGNILNSPASINCTSNSYSRSISLSASDGLKNISITQTDRAGNVSTVRNLALTLDTSLPVVPAPSITSPATNSFTRLTSQTITGACITGNTIRISGLISGSPVTTSCASNSYSRSVLLTGSDGAKTISAVQVNSGGTNSSATSIVINLDQSAPSSPTVSSPANSSSVTSVNLTMTGTCESNAVLSISGNILNSPVSTTCTNSNFSRALSLTNGDGTKNIAVTQTDRAGNTSTARNISLTLNTSTPEPVGRTNVRLYIFGHSLIVHENTPQPTEGKKVPHWMGQFSQFAGLQFAVDGQYGFLRNHADFSNIQPQWSFQQVNSVWTNPSAPFASVDYNTIMLTPANFIQYQSPSSFYYDSSTVSPLSATLSIVDQTLAAHPNIPIYIYENWPLMDGYGSFPGGINFVQYNNDTISGNFHQWFITYHDAILAQRPSANVRMIPVGPILSKLFRDSILSGIPLTELYEDNAPHGQPNLYFLAAMVTYMALYQTQAPSLYMPPSSLHSLIRSNYSFINNFIWTELQNFNLPNTNSRVF